MTRGRVHGVAMGALVVALILVGGQTATADRPGGPVARDLAGVARGPGPGPDDPTGEAPPEMEVGADQAAAKVELDSAGMFSAYTDVYAGSAFLEDGHTLEVYYSEQAPTERVEAFLAAVAEGERHNTSNFTLQLTPVPASQDVLHGLAREISADEAGAWSARLGVEGISFVNTKPETGTVEVGAVGDAPSSTASELTIDGVSVTIRPGIPDGPAIIEQSRDDDVAPWSGGASLRPNTTQSSSAFCTAGFNWRRWSTGERYSSTADHCYANGSRPSWYNWGTLLGTVFLYSDQVDTVMLRTSPQSQVNPNVFVGNNNTTTVRWVTAVSGGPSVSEVVALSGGNSGLTATTVVATGTFDAGVGPMATTAMTTCVGGDSGSPVLTTSSSASGSNVTAHGQHKGEWDEDHTWAGQCVFLPVISISAALSVSILTT